MTTNEIVCVGEYALKRRESYRLTRTIITHCSGSAGCWKTHAREENSQTRSRTTEFTLADSQVSQQTHQSIVQCKPSFRLFYERTAIAQTVLFNFLLLSLESTDVWTLHDHHRIKTVKGRQGRTRPQHTRMDSSLKNGSENLGYIPEHNTLSINPNKQLDSVEPKDNLVTSTSSAKELVLDLSELDVSLSTDQFSFRKPSRTEKFYEAFGTPRDSIYTSYCEGLDNSNLLQTSNSKHYFSNPNISSSYLSADKPVTQSKPATTSSKPKYVKKHEHTTPSNAAQIFSHSLPLATRYGSDVDLWSSNKPTSAASEHNRVSKMRYGDSRVNYLTQLKVGETVRLQEAAKRKKRKGVDPKGTIHYAFKSDLELNRSYLVNK